MSSDPFDELLEIENDFYKGGFEAGVTDSAYAGLIEGKIFGIEKGYEKALEIGKARGRALVWQQRLDNDTSNTAETAPLTDREDAAAASTPEVDLSGIMEDLPPLSFTARLKKHIDTLLSLTDPANIPKDNSDDSVSEVDERITKIRARIKMISNMVGEPVRPGSALAGSIEDSNGLQARR